MKQFEFKVKWAFKISVEGYGRNVREALLDAASRLDYQVESEFADNDLESIEKHEVINIDESDIELDEGEEVDDLPEIDEMPDVDADDYGPDDRPGDPD